MSKVMRLTERDLTRLVSRIINEQSVGVPYGSKKYQLPSDNSLYIEMTSYVEGDGPEVMKYVPNKMLVIGQSNGTKLIPLYTITKHN